MPVRMMEVLPRAQSCRRVDFDSVQLLPGRDDAGWMLHVTGPTPCVTMRVQLIPRLYVERPDFWEIEIVGYLPSGVVVQAVGGYSVTIPLSDITGFEGVEVVGASLRERLAVPSAPGVFPPPGEPAAAATDSDTDARP